VSYEELSYGRRVARKEHVCQSCGRRIRVGHLYSLRVYKYEGDFNAEKLHMRCDAELQLFSSEGYGDDGFNFSEVHEFIEEVLREYGHVSRERREA